MNKTRTAIISNSTSIAAGNVQQVLISGNVVLDKVSPVRIKRVSVGFVAFGGVTGKGLGSAYRLNTVLQLPNNPYPPSSFSGTSVQASTIILNENLQNEVNLYVPANGLISIQCTLTLSVDEAELFDLQGSVVFEFE